MRVVSVDGDGQVHVAIPPGAVPKNATCSTEAWPDGPRPAERVVGTMPDQAEGQSMSQALVRGGIALDYETFGNPSDPAVLLIAGFGAQMLSWDSGFCGGLAQRPCR